MSTSASHTKNGPGRKHQHCLLRFDADSKKHFKLEPHQRLKPATGRMNFKGRVVLSYAEHDKKTREGVLYVPSPILGSVDAA